VGDVLSGEEAETGSDFEVCGEFLFEVAVSLDWDDQHRRDGKREEGISTERREAQLSYGSFTRSVGTGGFGIAVSIWATSGARV